MYLDSTLLQKIRKDSLRVKEAKGTTHGRRQVQAVLDDVSSASWYNSATAVLSEVGASYTFNDGLWTPSTTASWATSTSTQAVWQANANAIPIPPSSATTTTEGTSSSTTTSIAVDVVTPSGLSFETSGEHVTETASATLTSISSFNEAFLSTSSLAPLSSASAMDDTILDLATTSSLETPLEPSSLQATSSASGSNTWITSTTTIPLPSGVTIIPIITFGKEGTSTAEVSSSTSSMAASAVVFGSGTSLSAFADPTGVHSVESLHTTGKNAAGIVAGSIAGVVVLVVAIFVYLRGGSIHGLGFRPKDPQRALLCTRKVSEDGPKWVAKRHQHQPEKPAEPSPDLEEPKELRRESIEQHHVEDDEWEDIDVKDPEHGHMSPDNGEWLEEWRKRKELLMTRQPPPELDFDPNLPLPPISTRTLESWDSCR